MKITSKQTDLVELGNAAEGIVGTMLIQLGGDDWSGSVQVMGRARWDRSETPPDYQPIPYVRRSLGGTASDDATVSAALTGEAIIAVDAAGLDVALDHTYTSGTLEIWCQPIKG